MQILGLEPVSVIIIICIIGVSGRVYMGMAGKSWKEFNIHLVMITFMLGMITSIGIVAPVIDALPNDIDPTLQLVVVAGQIGLVMGVDSVVRKGYKISQKIKDDKSKDFFEPEPIDDDLPPGNPGEDDLSIDPGPQEEQRQLPYNQSNIDGEDSK